MQWTCAKIKCSSATYLEPASNFSLIDLFYRTFSIDQGIYCIIYNVYQQHLNSQDQANPVTLLNIAGRSRGHCLHVHESQPDGYEQVHAGPGNLWHAARAQRHGRLPLGLWQHAVRRNAKHGDGNGTTVNSHNQNCWLSFINFNATYYWRVSKLCDKFA